MKNSCVFGKLILLVFLLNTVCPAKQAHAGVYNLHLVTDNMPDYTDLDSFVQSVTGHLDTPQEKCIAVWRWGRRSRRQTSCSTEDGRLILDPILHYNSYGTMNCGIISALNMVSWLELGYKARYIQLGDHTVSEVSWDDGANWHLFDSSMSFFCYNGRGVVAGCQEIMDAHSGKFSGGVSEPGYYYYYHGAPQCISHRGKDAWRYCSDNPVSYKRTLANGASSYTNGFSVDKYTLHVRRGHRYILNLHPGQSYTRYWKPLEQLAEHNWEINVDDMADFYRPLKGKDPDEQHNLHNIRGNGLWLFEPDFANADCRETFYDSENIEVYPNNAQGPALGPERQGGSAFVVFKVSAANVITSMLLEAGALRTQPDDIVRISVSRNAGITWLRVWESGQIGSHPVRLKLRDEVAGVTECLVKVEMLSHRMKTGAGLDRLKLTTITQLNRRTLPKLTLGSNRVRLSADRQTETAVFWPPLHADQYKTTVFSEKNVYSNEKPDGMYKATLGAGRNGTPCEVTWRVKAPTDILGVTYGAVATNRSPNHWVSLQYSFDGREFREFYRKEDGDAPFDKQVLQTYADGQIPSGARQAFFRGVFFCNGGAATYGMPGIQDLLLQIEYQPRNAQFQPVEITYGWTEHRTSGDVTRTHTELVSSLPHTYTINIAGFRDPTMNWVRMNLKGSRRGSKQSIYGYSDAANVGPACEPTPMIYAWGNNLASGRAYTSSRPSSSTSRNPDTGGCELTNGKIIAPTDYTSGEMVKAATAFWSAGDPLVLVVDLGEKQSIEGVRVSSHQPNDKFCHPRQIDIALSVDRRRWRECGRIEHNDLWQPPGDYEPWEHDDNPKYNDLPAAGRLAYSYPLVFEEPLAGRYVRFVCVPLEGRGMGLSELEVFDEVKVHPAPALVAAFPR